MLGRFLEISIATQTIRDSLEFYEALGFVQVPVGETWPHPYAVVTDGRLFLGLHNKDIASPTLTYVQPDLARKVTAFERLSIEFAERQLDKEVFNHVTFSDPVGQHITLLEARTFSPPALDDPITSLCGYFSEYGIPAKTFDAVAQFWEPLGFVALELASYPFPRLTLASDSINVTFYKARAIRRPVLTFEAPDMERRLTQLRARGFTLSNDMPEAFDENSNAILETPEGTRLLLLQANT